MSTSENKEQNEKLQKIIKYIEDNLSSNTMITLQNLNEYFDLLSKKKLPPQTTTTKAPEVTTTQAPEVTTTQAPVTTTEQPIVEEPTTTQEVVITQPPVMETQPQPTPEPKVIEKHTIPKGLLRNFGSNCAPVFNTIIH